VPSTARAARAAIVATPDRCERKFSAVRSAVSSARAGPSMLITSPPCSRQLPSAMKRSARACGSGSVNARPAARRPWMTPGCSCVIRPRAGRSGSTVAAVVASPGPTSSSSALLTSAVRSCTLSALPGGAEQVRAHEPVEVPVEHPLDVAHLIPRAVILDHRVWVQHVGADLRAEVYVLRLALLARDLLLALALVQLQELRPQHRHRRGAVGGLRALVLTLHHDAGGQVRDAHRRVGLVD